ncbi:hypothetical protein A2V49_03860 [candidate division WWE3 bacterium RBG_19FT_COMBO_34_6]|uniref:AB hydrolase-1 domain-containing protein n=1 Tax=candidate division WWE3 bacterium RBG_19FT_COMBO_34_6 TaxID=1802612 RepID=A0A1F4UKV5_UNCKA|nr:MAG: hypothetical protein A2V49_03860 [candidate division WWE3 bacterium RBG_19FT_COMBO_34_6]
MTTKSKINTIKLQDTKIAYIKYGQGPVLIVLGGIMARIDSWMYVIDFLSQKFTVYFIELPGYGNSSPFNSEYSSERMGMIIKDFTQELKIEKFSIIGFSFGSFVSLFALKNIISKIDKVFLIAPCISYKVLNFNRPQLIFSRAAVNFFDNNNLQKLLMVLIKNKRFTEFFILIISRFSNKDIYSYKDMLASSLISMRTETINVLVKQIKEVLYLSPIDDLKDYNKKIYLGMSKQDQFLNYEITHKLLSEKFSNLEVFEFNLSNHQPLEPLSQEFLQKNFSHILENM